LHLLGFQPELRLQRLDISLTGAPQGRKQNHGADQVQAQQYGQNHGQPLA
jgi:hypothetical protein